MASSSTCVASLTHVGDAERAARDREPVDDRVLLGGELADAVAEELLERRRQPAEARVAALGAHENRDALAALGSVSRISSAPRSSSASTISSRKNGFPPTLRQQVGADLPHAVAHAEARLDEPHLLVGRQAAQLDAHHAFEGVERRGRRGA